jgi:energy-coupling factor transporter ATP-binding protein EcfA2
MPKPDTHTPHPPRQLLAVQEAAVAKLAYVAEQPGAAAVLCGPPGSGKSLVLEAAARTLESVGHACRIVSWRSLREAALGDCPDVLLVDAVDDAADGELAAMLDGCWAANPQARIILAGAGRLLTLMARDARLERRIRLRAVLTPCSRAETQRLVADRLATGHDQGSGSTTAAAVADTIHEITGGIPADIERLASLAALVAADRSTTRLSPEVIERVHARLAVTAA